MNQKLTFYGKVIFFNDQKLKYKYERFCVIICFATVRCADYNMR